MLSLHINLKYIKQDVPHVVKQGKGQIFLFIMALNIITNYI